jgi:hypothetical protein
MACQRETNFERKDELYKYLYKEQGIDLSQKGKLRLVILQVGNCGACTREVLDLLERKIPNFTDSTLVLMARRDSSIEANLAQVSKVKVLTDDKLMLSKYGLRYVTDYIFFFEAGELKKTYRLDEYGLKNAERQLKG